MTEHSHEALVASINLNPKIVAIKEGHEQELAATLENLNMSVLQSVFRLGFDAGVAHADKNPKKD